MILTSYFANFRKFNDLKTVSISRFTPVWSKGHISGLELAPSADLLFKYKEGLVTELEYEEIYNKQLSLLDPKEIFEKYDNCILLCYEKSSDFCHRQLVSKWLNSNGFECKELK